MVVHGASQEEDIRQLLVQGHYWIGQGHPDLAVNSWEKVLLTDPDNSEALNALQELKSFHPSLIDRKKLALARKLARQHKYADALEMYKQAFAGGTPNSFYAAEYYETLSGTRHGWKKAVTALQELTQKYPSNSRYRLVYGRVLTYHQSSRYQGLEILEKMAGNEALDSGLREEAVSAWKNALLWLPASSREKARYQRYLALFPDDKEITYRLEHLDEPGQETTLEKAYQLLEAGKLKKAASIFSRLVKASPDNADALAGLGITQMRQRRFSSAARNLEKAIRIAPEEHHDLEKTLLEAQFWAAYKQAERAYKQDRFSAALSHLGRAEQYLPGRFESLLLRANIEARRGNTKRASRYYDKALALKPGNQAAGTGLLQLLVLSGDEASAASLLKKHGLSEREFRRARNQIKAAQLRASAAIENDPDIAIIDLRSALALDPENGWLRLDLARRLAARGQTREAESLFTGYLSSFPNDYETRFAAAVFFSEVGELQKARIHSSAIPAEHKSEDLLNFEQELQARLDLQRARTFIDKGDYVQANLIAESLQARSGDNPATRLVYAELLARLGEEKDALWVAQHAYAKARKTNIGAALQYANVLLLTHQYKALDSLLTELRHQPRLTPAERASLAELRLGLELELADNLRKSGNYKAAYEQLLPFLPRYDDNSAVRSLLASIYQDAGDHDLALKLFQEETAHHPDNRDAWAGAIGAAMSLQDFPLASSLVEQALNAVPDDPGLLIQRARLSYMNGSRAAALKDIDQALQQERASPSARNQIQYPAPGKSATQIPLPDLHPWSREARELTAQIKAETGTSLSLGTGIRMRDGNEGLDQLTETTLPIQFQSSLNADMKWGVMLRPTLLTAGRTQQATRQLLGSQALTANGTTGEEQKDEGLGLTAFYKGRRWDADLGLSGAGFEIDNLVGGLSWKQRDFGSQLILGADRRAIKDSVLSYAGLKDPATGTVWGGVTQTSAKLDYYLRNLRDVPAAIHAHASVAMLDGDHVEDNTRLKLESDIQWSLLQQDNAQAELGLRLTYQHFDKNLRGFTLGQGGYFSPQQYLALAIPVRYNAHQGAFHYGMAATFGIQYFEEDDTPFFPLDQDLQSQVDALLPEKGFHEGQSRGSFTIALRAGFEYKLNQEFSVGGLLSSAHDNDYDETGGAVFLRYYFDRPTRLPQTPGWLTTGPFTTGLW